MITAIICIFLPPILLVSWIWMAILQTRIEKLKKTTVSKSKYGELEKLYNAIRPIHNTYNQKTEYSQTIINPK